MDQPGDTTRAHEPSAAYWRARAEQLQATVDRLRSLAVAGESAGFLAHELNNLFTPVAGYAQAALADGAEDGLKRKALQKSLAAAERVGELSRAILQLAGSVESNEVGGESDLLDCVQDGLLVLGSERWGRDGIDVAVDVPRGTVVGARSCVAQQVVMNLVLNARRAMVGRRGAITITGRVVGGRVVMEVGDQGKGMDEREVGRVYGISKSDVDGASDHYSIDVQELARSGSINGQARWGVRVKKDAKAGGGKIDRLRGARLAASMSPIRVWDAGEVARELRGGEDSARSDDDCLNSYCERGSGLGVALCRELVGRAGGAMSARSVVGEGTVVRVEWPLARGRSLRDAA